MREYWVKVRAETDALSLLEGPLQLSSWESDDENRWAWTTAWSEQLELKVNLRMERADEERPLRIDFGGAGWPKCDPKEIGQRIADALGSHVGFGWVSGYDEDETFELIESFVPQLDG